ncbi:metal-sensitive transcriptional regulator [Trueperella pyogenes]
MTTARNYLQPPRTMDLATKLATRVESKPMTNEELRAEQRKALNRLKRARGQLNAVIDNFENGGQCVDVIHQLAAVTSALNKAGYTIVAAAMKNCVLSENPTTSPEELEKAFSALA